MTSNNVQVPEIDLLDSKFITMSLTGLFNHLHGYYVMNGHNDLSDRLMSEFTELCERDLRLIAIQRYARFKNRNEWVKVKDLEFIIHTSELSKKWDKKKITTLNYLDQMKKVYAEYLGNPNSELN